METQEPRRRWFRFRLRTLLILVTVLSVPLGWIGWELDQRRREKPAIAWVEEMGGHIFFNSATPQDERSWWKKTKDKWFGERVWYVRLPDTEVSNLSPLAELQNLEYLELHDTLVSDLSPLANLKYLEVLALNETQVSDLSPLAELKNLDRLYLDGTHVKNLSPLAELKNLRSIDLNGTQVNEAEVQELRLALPNCKIRTD